MTKSQAEAAGWLRFIEVTEFVPAGQKLYRSSAPSYKKVPNGDNDSSQNLTPKAIKFPADAKIDNIISFNKYTYRPDQIAKLKEAKIEYLHLAVEDFHAPTVRQLKDANVFFVGKKATLVHCGYGHSRTGTGVTGLQICTANGQTLDPYACKWWGNRGNHVEKRRRMSVLAELRNGLLQNRRQGVPDADPKKRFAIINVETGYYLTISSDDKHIVVHSPESVEKGPRTRREYLWIIKEGKTANTFTLSNHVTFQDFATTKSSGAKVDDPVENGIGKDANILFTLTEAAGNDRGLYMISPSPNPNFAVAMKEPDDSLKKLDLTQRMPALLASKDENKRLGLWIILPILK